MILVFGKTGQVATELQALADVTTLSRDQVDLVDPQTCAEVIHKLRPRAVINAAAYTAVDKAEKEEGLATIINGDAPTVMAQTCAALGIPFVHLSTDYVFDGVGDQPFGPNNPVNPVSAYGRSKLMGEAGVSAAAGNYIILRTSWVFSAHGHNFLKTMLRLGSARDELAIVADQIGGPTPARDIAKACLTCVDLMTADPSLSGIYHFSGTPNVSWADFSRAIFTAAGMSVKLKNIPTSAFPTLAVRPANSRLDCSGLHRLGLSQPDWYHEVQNIMQQLEVKL